MTQHPVSDRTGATQRQHRGGGIEITTAGYPPVGERVTSVEAAEIPANRVTWIEMTDRIKGLWISSSDHDHRQHDPFPLILK